MVVDDPDVLAEVRDAFAAYEAALVANDVAALDEFFWRDPRALRYGVAEHQYGHAAIAAYRAAQPDVASPRDLDRTAVTALGRDFAVASTLFRRSGEPGRVGRQMQTWARLPEGWRIVAAHVSVIADPEPSVELHAI